MRTRVSTTVVLCVALVICRTTVTFTQSRFESWTTARTGSERLAQE